MTLRTLLVSNAPARRAPVRRLLPAAVWALLLFALLLVLLARTPRPLWAQEGAGEPPVTGAAATAGVTVTLGVRTTGAGFATAVEAVNGGIVTYRVQVRNGTGQTLSKPRVEVVLPAVGLDTATENVACTQCDRRTANVTVNNALGDSEEIVIVRELSWVLPDLAANAARVITYSAPAVGQAGGAPIETSVLAFYTSGGQQQSAVSNKVTFAIVAERPTAAVSRETAVSSTPTWYSSDLGGTLDMDWADIDGDGDLDLAFASTLGTNVYLNDGGLLKLVWSDPQARTTYGVRWLDVDGDNKPELVAVGTLEGEISGRNYVFRFNPGTVQSPDRLSLMPNGLFTSTAQLVRMEGGDFNGDGLPDLLVSVNSISAECPVFLLFNQGANLFRGTPQCVSQAGSAAISVADANNDGELDVALGLFPNQIRVFLSDSGVLTQTVAANNIAVDSPGYFLPYDFAWGDIDRDGDLDLAAAFPLQRQVRIYRNRLGESGAHFQLLQPILPTDIFLTPYALEWADVDRDGLLDLVVADSKPKIYWNTGSATAPFSVAGRTLIDLSGSPTEVWAVRAVDQDGDGTLELAIANRNGPSLLLANYAPALDQDLTPIDGVETAGSVAWGDVDNNGFNDLLFGAPGARVSSLLYSNEGGTFSFGNQAAFSADATGRHSALLGDLDKAALAGGGGGELDVVLATPSGVLISRNQGALETLEVPGLEGSNDRVAALGDADGDGDLDLAVAADEGPVYVIENRSDEAGDTEPRVIQISAPLAGITSLAWGDLNGDHYLDLAVGGRERTLILVNNGDMTFTPRPLPRVAAGNTPSCLSQPTMALAWADFDGDGDPDLALGNSPGPSCVLLNTSGNLSPFVTFSENMNVSTLDWGDWDNDGDLDLAVGHRRETGPASSQGAPVRVYTNIGTGLLLTWESAGRYNATSVRFGDRDNDGDLDLALAQDLDPAVVAGASSGYFDNRTVTPAHLLSAAQASLLPNESAYVSVARPGATRSAYLFSSSELLAGPRHPTVTVEFRVFDPDGDESSPKTLVTILPEFSLSGGGNWQPASPAAGQSTVISTSLSRTGEVHTFVWDAFRDKAISEKAVFRISVVNPSSGAVVQSAAGVGTSPPFQVRATSCIWPADPLLYIDVEGEPRRIVTGNDPVTLNYALPDGSWYRELRFAGTLGAGTGLMRFEWSIDNGERTRTGQNVRESFTDGTYNVLLTVRGPACPIQRPARRVITLVMGTGRPSSRIYLPMTANNGVLGEEAVVAATAGALPPPLPVGFEAIPSADGVLLRWSTENDLGAGTQARIYASRLDTPEQLMVGVVPAAQGEFFAPQACDLAYALALANDAGESFAEESYFTEPCETGGTP